ncbi:CoA transferase [Acidobacteria bacterium AH-259-O06]|nr:CoA transferase [Acidobacteria bacterium AH-259-O06]
MRLDLKSDEGRQRLNEYLQRADLFLTAMRPGALRRLNLHWDSLRSRYPRLCHVAIIGYPSPQQERSGHDLTYQAVSGLLDPPRMPRTLLADLVGAERAVSAALALLFHRERTEKGCVQWVSLQESAAALGKPIRHGLTSLQGALGGGSARYSLYATQDGWAALAALEERLWQHFLQTIDRPDLLNKSNKKVRAELEKLFRQRPTRYWADLARRLNLPLEAVVQPEGGRA